MEAAFTDDKSNYYRGLLHNLQATLASIQQGTNDEYLRRKTHLEQDRDYELTRLRLWEEYQVKRVEDEYKESLETATSNYDMMVKLLKEKYYDKLQKQVKQLKEDKLLLNLVNASLWSSNPAANLYSAVLALSAAAAASSLSLTDRRSRRKREYSSRFMAGETDDVSDSGAGSASMLAGHMRNGNGTGSGYASALKRRRHYQTRYSSAEEHSSAHNGSGHMAANGGGSGNDSNLSDKDYDTLNHLIMNNEEGGVSQIIADKDRPTGRPHTRGAHRQFVGVQGLKPEELSDDLTLLRNAVKREK